MNQGRKLCYVYFRTPVLDKKASDAFKEKQEIIIRNWFAKRKNSFKLAMISSDDGYSGICSIKKRPELMKTLNCIRRGNIFLTPSAENVAMKLVDFLEIIEIIREKYGFFASIAEEYETFTLAGITRLQLSLSIIGLHKMQTSRRFTCLSESVPYGWTKMRSIFEIDNEFDDKNGNICDVVEDVEKQEILTLIRQMYEENKESSCIAECLNNARISTLHGDQWSAEFVQKVQTEADIFIKTHY